MMKHFHPYHMISPSPWAIINALISWNLISYLLNHLSKTTKINMMIPLMIMTIMAFMWWTNIFKETTKLGSHHNIISKGLKTSMILFITSEIMFFLSFFWAYFHSSISPNMEMGLNWPPKWINTFNPMNVPLLNTIILVSSGVSITWSHNEMMKKKMNNSNYSLMTTCILGMFFSILQIMEYMQSEFSISDSSYGNTFFMATGFHGLHVMIGTSFLMTMLYRIKKMESNKYRMTGLEMAAWYWHFVDVVWLLLFLSIYWWSH